MASSPAALEVRDAKPVPIDRVHQLEEALQECQALALAGQFAAATMHEINGPLEAIANLNYLVQTNSDDGEQVRNYSGLLREQLGALNNIASDTELLPLERDGGTHPDRASGGSCPPYPP